MSMLGGNKGTGVGFPCKYLKAGHEHVRCSGEEAREARMRWRVKVRPGGGAQSRSTDGVTEDGG